MINHIFTPLLVVYSVVIVIVRGSYSRDQVRRGAGEQTGSGDEADS